VVAFAFTPPGVLTRTLPLPSRRLVTGISTPPQIEMLDPLDPS
jgi:hypothetical protein